MSFVKFFKRSSIRAGIIPFVLMFVFILILSSIDYGDGRFAGAAFVIILFPLGLITLFISFICFVFIYIKYFIKKAILKNNTLYKDFFGLSLAALLPFLSLILLLVNTKFSLSPTEWETKLAYILITLSLILVLIWLKSGWLLYQHNKLLKRERQKQASP
jgi:hypothetical protein